MQIFSSCRSATFLRQVFIATSLLSISAASAAAIETDPMAVKNPEVLFQGKLDAVEVEDFSYSRLKCRSFDCSYSFVKSDSSVANSDRQVQMMRARKYVRSSLWEFLDGKYGKAFTNQGEPMKVTARLVEWIDDSPSLKETIQTARIVFTLSGPRGEVFTADVTGRGSQTAFRHSKRVDKSREKTFSKVIAGFRYALLHRAADQRYSKVEVLDTSADNSEGSRFLTNILIGSAVTLVKTVEGTGKLLKRTGRAMSEAAHDPNVQQQIRQMQENNRRMEEQTAQGYRDLYKDLEARRLAEKRRQEAQRQTQKRVVALNRQPAPQPAGSSQTPNPVIAGGTTPYATGFSTGSTNQVRTLSGGTTGTSYSGQGAPAPSSNAKKMVLAVELMAYCEPTTNLRGDSVWSCMGAYGKSGNLPGSLEGELRNTTGCTRADLNRNTPFTNPETGKRGFVYYCDKGVRKDTGFDLSNHWSLSNAVLAERNIYLCRDEILHQCGGEEDLYQRRGGDVSWKLKTVTCVDRRCE